MRQHSWILWKQGTGLLGASPGQSCRRNEASLALLEKAEINPESRILVFGGDTALAEAMLDRGLDKVSMLDASWRDLADAREQLGARASQVRWLNQDITQLLLEASGYTHWHDDNLMRTLTEPREFRAYARQIEHTLISGGYAVIGGRSAAETAGVLGPGFQLVANAFARKRTPTGKEQMVLYTLFQRL